ncbi:MAG: hypothetical protein IKL13_01155 [Clostridia bacterium]|nr:hypothetical protein [Clostridia bacterium]
MNQTAPTKRRTRTLILWILLSVILLALVCAAVWFFMGCPPGIPARKTAVLCYDDPSTSADTPVEVTLTEEETRMVRKYMKQGNRRFDGAGCLFNETSIAFGRKEYAIALDGCPAIREMGNEKAYELSDEGMDYIVSLFEKYAGCFP